MKGTMHHAKTSFSTEIFAGAITSVFQYLAPLQYVSGPQDRVATTIRELGNSSGMLAARKQTGIR
jgi:hypothetical protein